MYGLAVSTKRGGGAASGTKMKRGDESPDRPSARRKGADEDDDASFEADDDEGDEGVSQQTPEEDADDEEGVSQRPTRSSQRKGKGKQVAKGTAKRGRGTHAEEEEDEDDSDSAGEWKDKGLRVERHSTTVRRAKGNLRAENKKLGAKGGKVAKTLDVSESSTDEGALPRRIYLPVKNGETFVEGRHRAARRVARAMNRSVLDREESCPPRTADEFRGLFPKPQYDEYWTKEQQAELVGRLLADGDFKKRLQVTPFVLNIWKTVFRFTGKLATDIVGPKTGLEFRSDSHKASNPAWTQMFCEALTPIILHPLLRLKTPKMALALQWAVICRTGYKSEYRLSGCEDDLSLQALVSTIEEHQDGNMTPGELLEAARVEYERPYGPDAYPSTWLEFLGHVWVKSGGGKGDAMDEDDVEGGPYFVNTTDLQVVVSALDRIKHLDLRVFADTRQVKDAVMPSRSNGDAPTLDHTRQAIKAVLLQKERNKERVRRGGRPEPSSHPGWGPARPLEDDAAREARSGRKKTPDEDDPFCVADTPVAVRGKGGKRGNSSAVGAIAAVPQGNFGDATSGTVPAHGDDSEELGDDAQGSQHLEEGAPGSDSILSDDGIFGDSGAGPGSSPDEAEPAGVGPASKPKPGEGKSAGPQAPGSQDPPGGGDEPVRTGGIDGVSLRVRGEIPPSSVPSGELVQSIYPEGLGHHPDTDSVISALSREAVWVARYAQPGRPGGNSNRR